MSRRDESNQPERVSHPWLPPQQVLARYGLKLDFEEQNEEGQRLLLVGISDDKGRELGEVNLQYDPRRDLYQIYYSALHELPRGEGLGTSVYRAIREYVGQHYGKTVASDYTRSAFANRAWQGMAKAGLAKRKIQDLPGVPRSTSPNGAGELDYYEMEAKLPEDVVTRRKRYGLLQAYRDAGCKTDRDILAMAASRGLTAEAEAIAALQEQRENSTAMVVVQATPPGKNLCAFLRKMLGERSKLIVAAQHGDLAPGAFEQMLRASMPDVEKKLRVMDVPGTSLGDALNMAERNRHYRPSQALEIYCSAEQAPGFTREVRGGHLNFDPTVIMVRPTQVPSDSADDIRKAVGSGDDAALHRVLDPHVFSDQDAVHEYSRALTESIWSPMDESDPHALLDIAIDAKMEGDPAADDLFRRATDIQLLRLSQRSDRYSARAKKGSKEIIALHRLLDDMIKKVQPDSNWVPGSYRHPAWKAALAADAQNDGDQTKRSIEIRQALAAGAAEQDFKKMASIFKKLQQPLTVPSATNEVLIEFLTNKILDNIVPSLDGLRLNEFGLGSPGPGLQMKASNSSAWASGRGALSEPEEHVPEDDTEDDEFREEEDQVGGGLDWGRGRSFFSGR